MSKKKRKEPSGARRARKTGDRGDAPLVLRLSTCKITWEPLERPARLNWPAEDRESIRELYFTVQERPNEAIPEILAMIDRHPDEPMLLNFLSKAYATAGDMKKSEEAALENYRRHPDYLFARTNYAQILLSRGEYKKVPEIFNDVFDLGGLYPERDTFHVSELVALVGVIGQYFEQIGDLETAENYLEILEDIDPDSPVVAHLSRMIDLRLLADLRNVERSRKSIV